MLEPFLIIILGVATYATRAGGFWLAQRLRPNPLFEAWLGYIPGAVFVAIVTPMVFGAGVGGWVGAAAGFAAMRFLGNFFVAILIGMSAYLLMRTIGVDARAL